MADQSVPNVNAITGSNVTLTILKHPLASYQRLTWLHTTNQKILEYFPNGKKTVFESVFKDRVDLDKTNGALRIYNVSKEDRGDYYMRMLHETEDQWKITMEVYGESGSQGTNAHSGTLLSTGSQGELTERGRREH